MESTTNHDGIVAKSSVAIAVLAALVLTAGMASAIPADEDAIDGAPETTSEEAGGACIMTGGPPDPYVAVDPVACKRWVEELVPPIA